MKVERVCVPTVTYTQENTKPVYSRPCVLSQTAQYTECNYMSSGVTSSLPHASVSQASYVRVCVCVCLCEPVCACQCVYLTTLPSRARARVCVCVTHTLTHSPLHREVIS